MPRSVSLSLTLAFALAVAGCDRGATDSAQPAGDAAAEATGTIDRSLAGEAMPALALKDPAGKALIAADLAGKPVLINLWATWCVPCVAEMPMLDALAAELGDSATVLTVSQDSAEDAAKVPAFFADKRLTHLPQWLDPDMALARGLGGVSLPLTVLYDAKGKEVWRVAGAFDWSSAAAREAIAEAEAT